MNDTDLKALALVDQELLLIQVYGITHERVEIFQETNGPLLELGYKLLSES